MHLNQLAGTTTGNFNPAFVPPRAGEGASPAVVGTFNASIKDLLSLVGAFGASKR